MEVWAGIQAAPAAAGPSAVTIGNFDGVHLGHRRVIDRLVAKARRQYLTAVAITFWPHPRLVHRPDWPFEPITSPAQRLELLAAAGIDAVLTIPYTLDFAATRPEDFTRRYLAEALAAKLVVVGRDMRFGRGNSGDAHLLAGLGQRYGFTVDIVDDLGADDLDGDGRDGDGQDGDGQDGDGQDQNSLRGASQLVPARWSSSAVRQALADGAVEQAARMLGRPHRLAGRVSRGQGRGRGLGFPTANLADPIGGMVPADGVYAGWLTRLDEAGKPTGPPSPAAISIGTNPTFGLASRRVEAHVLGRHDLDLYSQLVAVDLVYRLRPMTAFADVEALRSQVLADIERTGALLATGPSERHRDRSGGARALL